MAYDDAFFTPDLVDEQIDLLSDTSARLPTSALPSPDARLIEDLRDLHAEAALERSLQRAWQRLEQSRTTSAPPPRSRHEPLIRPDFQEERPPFMKHPTLLVPDGRKLISRLGVMAAACVLIALVSGLTAGLILIRQHKTSAAGTATATVQPTATAPSAPPQVNLYLNSLADGSVSKFDPIARKTLWTYQWNKLKNGSSGFGPLLIGDGTVYFSAGAAPGHSTVKLSLYALDMQHGTLRWQTQQPDSAYPALVGKGVVYVTAADGLYALNASDGAVRWHAPVSADDKLVLANGVLYGTIFHDTSANQWSSTLFAVNAADGTVLWQLALPKNKSFTVSVAGNGVLYLSSVEQKYPSSGALIALDDGKPKISYAYAYSLDGKQLWHSQKYEGYISPPISANGNIYFASQDTMYALDARSGATRWHYRVNAGAVEGRPIIADGTIYLKSGPLSSGTSIPTTLIALNAQTGAVQWKRQIDVPTYALVGAFVLANDALYLIVEGEVSSLRAFSVADGKPLWQVSLGRTFLASLTAAP
jgi:outer membrane protein assembly factor BamB